MKKYSRLRATLAVITAAALSAFAMPSQATLITSATNNPYGFSWSTDTVDGILSGFGSLSVAGFGTATLAITVSLTNTSPVSTNRLTSFGFAIDPDATNVGFSDAADGGMIGAAMDDLPSLGLIEVCSRGGPNNCNGGGNGGILGLGGTDSFVLNLTKIGNWGSSVDIAPLGYKYQTAGDSYEDYIPNTPNTPVPEPGTMSLLGAGILCLGLLRRRRLTA